MNDNWFSAQVQEAQEEPRAQDPRNDEASAGLPQWAGEDGQPKVCVPL